MDALAINFVINLAGPMPQAEWDAIWLATSPFGAKRAEAAIRCWSLEYTEIIVPDLPPIPAIGYTDLVAWAALSAAIVAPGPKCPDGCTQPERP